MTKQNPERPAPKAVTDSIVALDVQYYSNGTEVDGVIEVHKELATDVREFFEHAFKMQFPIEKVVRSSDDPYRWNDDSLMDDNASSGYNYRLIKGTDRPSLHGLGRAFDINPRINPYIRYTKDGAEIDPPGAEYNPNADGALFAQHALVVFMKSRGWEWGGDWLPESGRTDYQHFEKPL